MWIAQNDLRTHADQLVHEIESALEHLLVNQHRASRLRRHDDRDTHQVGREGWPGRVINLGNGAAHIHTHSQVLFILDDQIETVGRRLLAHAYAQAIAKNQADHAQLLGRHATHPNFAVGHRAQADVGADLGGVGRNPELSAVQAGHAVDDQCVTANALYLRAHLHQTVAQVLHMRFGRGVANNRGTAGQDGRHNRILGAGHAGFVQQNVGASQMRRNQSEILPVLNFRAQRREGQQVGVNAAAADLISARHGQLGAAAARQQRPRQGDRAAYDTEEVAVQLALPQVVGAQGQAVLIEPARLYTQAAQQLQHGLDVADGRHIAQNEGLIGQKRGCQQGQRRVFVA